MVSNLPTSDVDLQETSILALQERMTEGSLTSRAIVQGYLERIERIDRAGPQLNSVIEVNPEAGEIAERLDAERGAGTVRGPLHGVPIILKDNIDTADRMQTTAGSLALEGKPAPRDAFLVERLRAAGAVILAKANLSEWANFRSTRSSSGWSSRGGQTKNPYALDRSPCGSSSGSAVAVSANLCAAAVGTETDGSIICPAHANGIVGIKPTLGLISRSGVVPIAHSQDTAGPLARSVADAALLLGAMTGVDARDRATRASAKYVAEPFWPQSEARGLKGARLGVVRDYFGFDERVDEIMERALGLMKAAGATLVDVRLPKESAYSRSELQVLFYEFKADLTAYLSERGHPSGVHSIADLIEFNDTHRDRVMPYFGQERVLKAAKKGPLNQRRYAQALEKNRRVVRTEGIHAVLRKGRLQALIAPAGGPAWLIDLINGDHHSGGGCTSPAAVGGCPAITVPAGHVFGLPIGLVLFARAWHDRALIALAHAYEQVGRFRRTPDFLPTADLRLPAWT